MSRAQRPPIFLSVLPLLLLSVLAGFACASAPPAPTAARIVIFHFNDVHGKIDNFAKVAAIIESERRGGGDVFLFCAGDNFTGNPVIDQYDPPGEPMLVLLNRVRLDLLSPGNHEFDFGLENLKKFAARARFPLVSANIEPAPGTFPQLKPYVQLETGSKIKITILGLIQVEKENGLPSTHPDKVAGLSFSDPLQKAGEFKKLRAGCQVFLALTHIGYEDDLKLAQQMPELDAIIGGHSHTRVQPAETVNGVLIAQAGSDNKFLGRIELRVENGRVVEKKGELIDLKTVSEEDAEVKAMIEKFNQNPAFARLIATAPLAIEGKDDLGSLMTDAMRHVHGLDVAFQNGGGIRVNTLPREITVKDVYTLDPFGNQIVQIAMDADEIRGLIRNSFLRQNAIDLQVSGLRYTVRVDAQNQVREVLLALADGSALPEGKIFKVGVSSYLASAYDFAHRDPGRSLQDTTAAALIRFLESGVDLGVYRGLRRASCEQAADRPRP